MPRKVLQTVTTPIYNQAGQHIQNRIDTYYIETPGTAPSIVTTQAAPPRPQTPAERLRTMSDAQKRQIALQALTVGVPPMPDVLGEAVRIQRERGLRP